MFLGREYLFAGLSAVLCTITLSVFGQNGAISLDEALSIARNNYAGLERDRLTIEQYNKLASTGMARQPTQLYFSSEEFGSNGQSGVHSINLQQNFYLPKVPDTQRKYYTTLYKYVQRHRHRRAVAARLTTTSRQVESRLDRL